MLSDKVLAAYNKQITAELYASNLYLAMGAYFDALAYRGFGNWLRVQSERNVGTRCEIIDIVVDRGAMLIFKVSKRPVLVSNLRGCV